jgi:mannose-6-phosphate isomerase-like protein (cupin superfamily)
MYGRRAPKEQACADQAHPVAPPARDDRVGAAGSAVTATNELGIGKEPDVSDEPHYTVIRSRELEPSPRGTVTFEGKDYGSGVSMFLINNEPGVGPNLHKHPYPETWIVREGNARFTAGDQELEASAGDILVVQGETPHKFKNAGPGRLDIICIHPSPRFIQEDLE